MTDLDTDETIVNLTPHDIHVYDRETKKLIKTFKASGTVCRCLSDPVLEMEPLYGKIPVQYAPSFYELEGLPTDENAPDILVSMPVGEMLRNRKSRYNGAVYGPNTGEGAYRNDKGQIIGTFGLVMYSD